MKEMLRCEMGEVFGKKSSLFGAFAYSKLSSESFVTSSRNFVLKLIGAASIVKSDPNGMTIDELARRARTTTRTLRLYQTKALLPPPRIVGRVGYYTEMHLNRLLVIERLQRRGFSLAGIAELFKIWQEGKSLDELFGVEAKLVQPWNQEEPEYVSREELIGRAGEEVADKQSVIEKLVELELLERLEDGSFKIQSPIVMNFGLELISNGVPIEVAIEQLRQLREDLRRTAARFLDLFRTHMLPHMMQGGPGEWLPRLAEYSLHMRPAVRAMMISVFTHAMDDEFRGITRGVELQDEEAPPESQRTSSSESPTLEAAAGDRR